MAKKFEITRGNAILNFSEEFCQSRCELVESESFSKVLEKFIKNQRRLETQLYIYLHERNADDFFIDSAPGQGTTIRMTFRLAG